jgi:hypothetical protein
VVDCVDGVLVASVSAELLYLDALQSFRQREELEGGGWRWWGTSKAVARCFLN